MTNRGRRSEAKIRYENIAWARRRMIALVQVLASDIDPSNLCSYWDVPEEPRDTLIKRLAQHAQNYSRQEKD